MKVRSRTVGLPSQGNAALRYHSASDGRYAHACDLDFSEFPAVRIAVEDLEADVENFLILFVVVASLNTSHTSQVVTS